MEIKKRLYLLIAAISFVLLVGSVGYYLLFNGEYLFIDCIYMTVISITSVGYGEVIEITGNVPAQIFTMILITFGMSIILYGLSSMTALLIEGELTGILRKNKMNKMVQRLKGHYIVCGGDETGRHLLLELVASRKRTVLIEVDQTNIESTQAQVKDLIYIEGDPTDDEHLIAALLVGSDRRGSLRPGPVLFGSGILATLALAGPAWQREPAPFTEDSAAVVVAIEVTPTMLAQDVQPSRLERASHKVRDLLALRPGARAGLVAFAGSAHTVMPLTADAEIVSTFAAELVPAIMPEEGEATGKAIALANRMLREAGVPGSILLVTDGVPPDQLAALEQERREGGAPVHLLVVAGDDGADVPPGSPPAPALDRAACKRASSAAGGSLTVVSADDSDVERLVNQVETSFAAVSDGGERWRDAGYWFLPLLLLGALLWFRPGWRVSNG